MDHVSKIKEHIQNILSIPIASPRTIDVPPKEVEKNLIHFLKNLSSKEEDEYMMTTKSGREITIKVNEMTGRIFCVNDDILPVIYIGETKVESGARVPYFYLFGERGICCLSDVYSMKHLKYENMLDIDILVNIKNK